MKTIAKRPARTANTSSRLVLGLLLGSSAWALHAPAMAQPALASSTSDVRVQYDIPAQPLAAALVEYARQSDLRVLSSAEQLSGLNANALHGAYTRDQALALLLSRSGVSAAIVGDTIQIDERTLPQRQGASGAVEATRATDSDGSTDAYADDDLIVTGTRIRGAAPAGAHVITLDDAAIRETGRTTTQDVLQTLPQNFPGSQNEASQLGSINSNRNLTFASTVDLRGLGADATLTLLNGRRLAPAGYGNFVDISAIPLAAVERVDVLADGASATYGTDAVAGVVNIILRRDFHGAETALRYGAATQGDPTELGFSQVFGRTWRTGSAMIGYEYRDRSALAATDRWFTSTSDLRPWGGSNFSSSFTNPGNITRIGATPVTLAIPEGQDGTSLDASDLLAGVINQRPANQGNSLLPQQTNHGLFASLRQELTPQLDLFVDVIAARREAESDRWQNNTTLVVPETNAYRVLNNLFPGQGVMRIAYNMGDDLGPTHFSTRSDAISLATGLGYDLGGDWRLEANASLGRQITALEQRNAFLSGPALTAALASSDLDTAFNPFGDGANSPDAALVGLTYDDFADGESQVVVYGAKLDGPVFTIWGGQARLAVGVERREENLELHRMRVGATGTTFSTSVPDSERTTEAVFAELYLPLIGPAQSIPGVQAFDVSLSVRREDASDFGEATTPKFGVTWAVNDDLALRASWGESFKAPQFQYLNGVTSGTILEASPAEDPFATNGSTGMLFLGGANPGLRPETAENWTAGVEYAPSWAPGARFSATYYDIDFVDRIATPGSVLAALAGAAGYESVFIRNPTQAQIDYYLAQASDVVGAMPADGIEAIFDERRTNLASLRTRGVDLNGAYTFDTSLGEFSVFAQASLILQYTMQTGAGTTPIDAAGTIFYPVKLRGRAGMSWTQENWSAGLTANYVDDYVDNVSATPRDVNEQVLWDARVGYRFGENDVSGPRVTLNIQNLFDDDPPFVNNPVGYAYDAQAASPLGRFVSLEVRQSW